MSSKVLYYYTTEEFRKELDRLGLPDSLVNENVRHETAHLNKARELGYRADLCIAFPTGDINNFRPAIHIYKGQNPTDEDIRKIISAAEDLSDKDKERLKSLEEVA